VHQLIAELQGRIIAAAWTDHHHDRPLILAVTAVSAFIVMTTMFSAPSRDKHREASAAGCQQHRDDDALHALLHVTFLYLFSALTTARRGS